MKLSIGYLYPDLFNLYGDRGNVKCLEKRLQWRGIEAEIHPILCGDRINFSGLDMICWGGGPDRGQEIISGYLKAIRHDFRAYVEDGGVVLAVCAAFQLLGRTYTMREQVVEGLGILDIHTQWQSARLVGNIILQSPYFKAAIVGFENHAGRTDIGTYPPLGKVVFGHGNTEQSGYEGIVYKNLIGTYLHGPLLPKNPEVCDGLLERALKRKYGDQVSLGELPDISEHRANHYMVERCRSAEEKHTAIHFGAFGFGNSRKAGKDNKRESANTCRKQMDRTADGEKYDE